MFVEVSSKRTMATVARLAREIWRDHYTPIIGVAQVAYMLDKFQSTRVICEQIENQQYRYFLIRQNHRAVGYIGLQYQRETLFLSKLYLEKTARGKGLGRCAVEFIVRLANEHALSTIRLTVNKHNTAAIAAYQRTGFIRNGEVVADIGGGYVMDDYVFERRLLEPQK